MFRGGIEYGWGVIRVRWGGREVFISKVRI